MNYYSHHIGDYRSDTAHLSLVEHGIYRQLLDQYYLTESPIPKETDLVCRRLRAVSEDEKKAVLQILDEFFTQSEDGYHHNRCDDEISDYHAKAEIARINGKLGGRPPKKPEAEPAKNPEITQPVNSANPEETGSQANQEPITNNHKPVKNQEQSERATRLPADWRPSDDDIVFCQTERPDLEVAVTASMFKDYWRAKAGKDGRKTDWAATWRNWVRNERRKEQQRGMNGYQSQNDKAKSIADRLTGRAKHDTDPRIIDINPAPSGELD